MKPNVLLIVFDDLTDSLHGLGGHPLAKTPHLDRLASRGVRFTNGHCNSPLCAPSRASFLSGLLPSTTGYYCKNPGDGNPLAVNPTLKHCTTLIEHLRDQGDYRIYGGGKVFHNGHERDNVWMNRDGSNGYGSPKSWGPFPWDGREETLVKHGWNNLAHPARPHITTDGVYGRLSDFPFGDEATPELNGWIDFGKPFYYKTEEDRDQLSDEKTADYLCEVLDQQHEDPFMACFGVCRPHTPNVVPDEFFDLFPLDQVELPPLLDGDLEDCCSCLYGEGHDINTGVWGRMRHDLLSTTETGLREWVQSYLASVAYADAQVGKVLNALENSAYADNTLVIVTADHGYHLGEKSIAFKNTLWEESTRIPFILSGPGISAGQPCDAPVSNVDLYPTIIDYCGLSDSPHGDVAELDGHSLRPFLENPETRDWEGHSIAVTAVGSSRLLETPEPSPTHEQHWAARSEQYRYIMAANGEEELYDRAGDPYEWHNKAGDPAYEEIKSKLKHQLKQVIGLSQ